MRLLLIIISILLCLPLSAKRKKKVVTPAVPPTQEQRIGKENTAKYRYFYLEAVRQQDIGNYADAFELLRHCLEIDSLQAEAHYTIARYYVAFQQDSLARHHYERAFALEPQNDEFAEQLGQYYLQHDNVDEAASLYERLSRQYADRTELLDILMQIYQYKKDYPKLLDVLARIETVEGPSEKLTLSKMQYYGEMGNDEGAFKAIDDLCKAHPNDLNYQVMMGNWLLFHQRKDEALQRFEGVLAEEPDHAQAQMSLMDYYRAEGQDEHADSMLYNMLENPKTEPQTRITLLRQVISENEQTGGDSTRILRIFHRVLALPQKTNEVALMHVAYLEYRKMPQDSIRAALEQVLAITPEETGARLKYIGILWEDSVNEDVINECKKAIDYSPKEPALYYYLGLAQYLNKHDTEALKAFRAGIALITSETNTKLCADLYMLSGDLYHQLGQSQKAYEAYDSCLVYNPDEISCLNNYAYYLSEEGRELQKAEQMSYRTIKAEPNNGTYLDTYAWILFKQKRYEEAAIYIDQALKAYGDNEISDDVKQHAKEIKKKLK